MIARLRPGMGLGPAALAVTGAWLAAASAHAATFGVIQSGPDSITVLNPATIEPVGDGKVRRAVSVNVQRSLVSGGPPQPGYVSTLNEYDCTAWQVRWRSLSAYSRFGEPLLHKANGELSWTPIDSAVEARVAARFVCDGRAPDAVYAAPSIGELVIGLMQAWDAEAPLPPLQPVKPIAPPRKTRKPAKAPPA